MMPFYSRLGVETGLFCIFLKSHHYQISQILENFDMAITQKVSRSEILDYFCQNHIKDIFHLSPSDGCCWKKHIGSFLKLTTTLIMWILVFGQSSHKSLYFFADSFHQSWAVRFFIRWSIKFAFELHFSATSSRKIGHACLGGFVCVPPRRYFTSCFTYCFTLESGCSKRSISSWRKMHIHQN